MANWQRKLDLRDVWPSKDVSVIAKAIADRLSRLTPLNDEHLDWKREELAEEFAGIASEADPEVNEFDAVMSELYDWGDTKLDGHWNGKAVCWIATAF